LARRRTGRTTPYPAPSTFQITICANDCLLMSTKDELCNYASRQQKRWFVICRSFLHGVACSEAVVNVSDKARRLRLSDGDHFEVPNLVARRTPLASPLPAPKGHLGSCPCCKVGVCSLRAGLFCLFSLFLAGKAVRPAPSERYPPELIDVMALFPGFPPCCCCCGCRPSPCALPVPPWHSDKAFWIHLDGYKHITSCGELPSEWLQILFVLERVLIGPDVQVDSTPSRASGYQLFCCA
jgi:hypothetical protein